MFTFNRNEQVVLLMLSAALLVGIIISYIDRENTHSIPDFDVQKSAVPVPQIPEETHITDKGIAVSIDVNTATTKDFEKLPGIGPQIAQRIVDHRTKTGSFTTLEDLTKVSGVGPKTLERLRPMITLSKP
ncbi:MAG: comEA protein [Candidatus Latescibacterota bacterium]|jgi:comEA protein